MAAAAVTPALLSVRKAVADLLAGAQAVVACSGGADSLALAAAAATLPQPITAVVVDHGLQPDSAAVAAEAAAQCQKLGLDTETRRVTVDGPGGPEAAARAARYAALREIASGRPILLAHTLDDQAETVLLRLARGSGARSLSAMSPVDADLYRPLLGLRRSLVRQACTEAGLTAHEDPHNADDRYARARLRHHGLPALVEDLGDAVVLGLARSATALREDNAALDAWAAEVTSTQASDLAALPRAVRLRVVRRMALAAGCPGSALTREHLTTVAGQVEDWRGQGPIDLPGGVRAARESGRLVLQ